MNLRAKQQGFRDETSHLGLTAFSVSSHLFPAPSADVLRVLLVPLSVPPGTVFAPEAKAILFYSIDRFGGGMGGNIKRGN